MDAASEQWAFDAIAVVTVGGIMPLAVMLLQSRRASKRACATALMLCAVLFVGAFEHARASRPEMRRARGFKNVMRAARRARAGGGGSWTTASSRAESRPGGARAETHARVFDADVVVVPDGITTPPSTRV